jgi:hypothetical protein
LAHILEHAALLHGTMYDCHVQGIVFPYEQLSTAYIVTCDARGLGTFDKQQVAP